MATKKKEDTGRETNLEVQISKGISVALEMLVRTFGLVNGTITIRARGGQLCRGIEVVNNVDVLRL